MARVTRVRREKIAEPDQEPRKEELMEGVRLPTRYVILKSRRNHNISIMYDGNTIIIPPGGKTPKLEVAKVGTLPSGVLKIEVS